MKTKNTCTDVVLTIIFGGILIVIFSPIIVLYFIVIMPLEIYGNYKFKKNLNKFIEVYNEKIFYIYSSKKRWMNYNLNYILPMLDDGIGRIYNEQGKIRIGFPSQIFYKYYYQLDKIKYPLFMKIIDNKAIGISIYNELVDLHDNKITVEQFQSQLKQKLKELEKTISLNSV